MSDVINIKNIIHEIRGQKVIIDNDLAAIYGVQTKVLNQAIKRNIEKFPAEFMFQLTQSEYINLRSQIVTSNAGGRRYLPFAFTEHGIIMLSSVLSSKIAIQMNIAIVKAFVAMRNYIAQPIQKKLGDLEKVLMLHIDNTNGHLSAHAKKINEIIDRIAVMVEEKKPRRKIGFRTGD
ncbi:MAG: ORF6N domain-containing protein [Rickettsiales bacterium]|jgi:phage regulator Rha-like protein|nr:ORF6N domain-containing protein [Rickettsiales bacterium]